MEKNINKQMSLEEYKKRAEEWIRKTYPNYTETSIASITSKENCQAYMEDFSPEVMVQGLIAGLI